MKLVVGLGNPGRKYEGTRHNIGFVVVQELAQRYGITSAKRSFQGEIAEANIRGQRTFMLWPHTYMNLSGGSVLAARDFYKLENSEVLIVCDDFNLPLAKLRFRADGSAGGQKGLGHIIERLATQSVPRLRIGVGPLPPNWDPADFVLGRFTADETTTIKSIVPTAADAIEEWIGSDIANCMNKYNG